MKHTLTALVLLMALTACGQDSGNKDMAGKSAEATSSSDAQTETGQAQQERGDQAFASLADKMIRQLWELFPSWAVREGYYAVADQLAVPDEQQRQRVLDFAREYKQQFADIDPTTLGPGERSDLAMVNTFLDRLIWEITEFKSYAWNPANYNVSHAFSLILNTDYAPLDERLRTFSQRLQKVPAYYEAARQSLDKPAAPQLELAIQQNKGALSVFGETLDEKIAASSLSAEEKQLLQERAAKAREAIEGYIAHLQEMKTDLEKTQDFRNFRIGEELYEEKFGYDIQIGMTAQELYQRALAEKDRLHEKMAELADRLWPKYFPDREAPEDRLEKIHAVLEKLSGQHATKETFKAEVEKQIPELVAFVKEKDLLTLDEDKPLVVRTTPPYMRGFSVASINAPGPYDKGANTYYNVMPIEEFSDEEAESFLREYNTYLMQILNIHEAIPGHYTQLVYANKSPSLIKSILANGAMIEGWAVYTERMMLEAGYGDFSPELWMMYYKWNLRTVINTILDYEIQVKGIDKERAMDLLVNQGFQQQAEAQGKWRRATLSQVQLTSYFAGYADILALREEMKEQLGEDFDLKEFHEKFLSYGNAPVPVIRELMLAELEGAGQG
ncbi:DUF885 domain-containing protein [Microbulbifer yueqingensis]|uniref:Uncharacterized conserved protein, DUF885 familyt n=1 Tax=Microbulbifer yueqingensis TaxID=658219 RepID=A0A1G9E1R4_9GAMM|nr:DUF885 domain-containing protein [Microbulbifer yueqingensis]SDK70052.1 Uncharacterized conserved protein, DUF885 familyt [Microbulbifer yueqingensis]